MNREQVREEIEAKRDRRTAGVLRSIRTTSTVTDAREQLRRGVSGLPGVSGDPDTVTDIMFFVDTFLDHIGQESVTD